MTIAVERYQTVMSTRGAEKRRNREEEAETGDDPALTKTDVFDVLKNERRRAVIQYLHEHGGSSDLSAIAEHIAASENDTTVQRLTSQERKRVRIALYQCHLPRMAALRVIEFDKDRGTVALREPASRVLVYLEFDPDDGRTTDASNRIAFAVAVGVAALVTVGTLGLGPLSAVPPAGWTAVSALALVAITGRQWRSE